VLAVDLRDPRRRAASAGATGVRADVDGAAEGIPPLAVIAVHPSSWPPERVETELQQLAGEALAPDWPAPVPLTVPEAAAWRALEFGLVPARARLVVLDPVAGEAAVVDRDADTLVAVGPAVALARPEPDAGLPEQLVALARQALDAAPAGPPFAGVVLAGSLPGGTPDGAELPGLVARVTGRAPLVPGDVDRVAVLGAAALGFAAATAGDDAASDDPAPDHASLPAPDVGAVRVLPSTARPAAGGARERSVRRRRRPRPWVVVAMLLVAAAVVAGLAFNRARTAPSPYTFTCPDGSVVAYSYECPTLAPSPSP
jgi:hypothetical protein